MTEKKQTQKEDEIIRNIMQSAKIEAPENLKYRIMRQIETEKAFTPRKVKPETAGGDMLKDFRGIFGVMYLLLFGLSLQAVIAGGSQAILSPQFILTALLIVVTLSSFWALTRLDAYLRKRKDTRHKMKDTRQ